MLSRDKLENKQEAAKVTLTEEFNIVLMLVPRPVRLLCLPGLIKQAYRLKALKVFNFVFKKNKTQVPSPLQCEECFMLQLCSGPIHKVVEKNAAFSTFTDSKMKRI